MKDWALYLILTSVLAVISCASMCHGEGGYVSHLMLFFSSAAIVSNVRTLRSMTVKDTLA